MLYATRSPINGGHWIVHFGKSICPIGPDSRAIFYGLQDLRDYLRATHTALMVEYRSKDVRELVAGV